MMVSLSSGRSPLDSSRRKSLRMNFLKPQSLPCTNRYARWLSVRWVTVVAVMSVTSVTGRLMIVIVME